MSKAIVKFPILLILGLVAFPKLSLGLTQTADKPPKQINHTNEMMSSIDAWNDFQQGINAFLQLDSAMNRQLFSNHQIHFNYFTLQEDSKKFLISLALPGVDPTKIRVSIARGVLFVHAKDHKSTRNTANAHYFSYHVALPENANTQKISAILKRGVLQIAIEKTNQLVSMMNIPVKEIT